MIKLLCLLLLLTSIACYGPVTPAERGIEVDASIYKIYNQDKALLMFERKVEDAFKVNIGNAFETATIYWADTKCPYNDENAVIYKNRCYYGITFSCDEIYVAIGKTNSTCGTALIHEHAHCVLKKLGLNMDRDHTGPIWPIVVEAQNFACNRGW